MGLDREAMKPSTSDIARAQQQLGWTDAKCAAALDVDRVTWARYKSGARAMTTAQWRYWLHVSGIERIPFRAAK